MAQQFNSWLYIHQAGMCPSLHQKACTQVFIAARLVIAHSKTAQVPINSRIVEK